MLRPPCAPPRPQFVATEAGWRKVNGESRHDEIPMIENCFLGSCRWKGLVSRRGCLAELLVALRPASWSQRGKEYTLFFVEIRYVAKSYSSLEPVSNDVIPMNKQK